MRYRVITPVERNGQRHEPGALLALPPASAAQLIAVGAVAPVQSAADPADSDGRAAAPVSGFEPDSASLATGGDGDGAEDTRRGDLAAACAAVNPADASLWTRSGVPQLPALRAASGLSDITAAERDAAWAAHQAQTHDPQSG